MDNTISYIFLTLTKTNTGVINWLQHHLLSCPFKQTFGIDCPGCGFQRSFLALMQGDFVASFKFYPATILMIGLFTFTGLHLKFDFKNGAFFIKILYLAIALTIVTNYTYKILTHQLS